MHETTHQMHRSRRESTVEMMKKAATTLMEIDWRLLRWLLRYPLQRADDLVVGVARWASRATVYRHLHGLEANRLIESVRPATPATGKRLYYLSNLGLHVLARHEGRSARDLARAWQADEAGLMRLLPRLPVLLVIQEVVNSLVMGAVEALTSQGRRPQLVRWTWQRDAIHRFQYREQTMHLFVDGAVALYIHGPQGDGTPLDRWYGVFLLFTQMDDERVMRLRLERLLCWRESPERWPSYQQMLPVLILAASPRQRDHWQHAVETSARKQCLDPLQGALACLSPLKSTGMNPWRLAWHTLSTGHSCHLRDVLRPVSPSAFLPSLDSVGSEEEESGVRSQLDASTAPGAARKLSRLVVGNLTSRTADITHNDLEEREGVALSGLCLTVCHWHILRLLLAHPLASDEELAGLLGLQRRSACSSLYRLHALGCLEPVVTEAGRRWHLCLRGLRLIAAANHLHIRNIAVYSDDDATGDVSHLRQRGESWLLAHIQHTAGVYGFFAALAQAARQRPEQELCWWETGALCERRYQLHGQWHNVRPDALAGYRAGRKQFQFWLEWDRGTMNARDLAIKFASYALYIDSREWVREWLTLPWLCCVVPDIAQERRMPRVAQAALSHVPGLMFWTTTGGLLHGHGPLASIWSPGNPPGGKKASSGGSTRQGIFEAIPE